MDNFFYKRIDLGLVDFPDKAQIEIPFTAKRIIIANDSEATDVAFSFDGKEIDGELFKRDAPIAFDALEANKIWLKTLSPTDAIPRVRVWAWRNVDV